MQMPTCKVCNGETIFTFNASEKMYGTGEVFQYAQCGSCGCLQLVNPPNDLSQYYQNYYGRNLISEDSISFKLRKKRFINDFRKKNILGSLLSYFFEDPAPSSLKELNLKINDSILDVGCADGFLLYMLKESGYPNVMGIDPEISSSIHYKNGLNIIKGDLLELKERKFDVVMLHHVLEHIEHPEQILNDISNFLNPDGQLLIRIPTCTSFAFDNYQENWYQLDAPRHIYLHSHDSIQKLLKKSNFEIIKIYCDSTIWQLFSSEEYVKGIPFVKHMKRYMLKLPLMVLTGKFYKKYKAKVTSLNKNNYGDQIVVIARKCN